MKECWVNIYYYKPLNKIYASHCIANKKSAIEATRNKHPKYKTLYRIHVKMK